MEEALDYVRGLPPALLGLEGSSMEDYRIYALDGMALIDGIPCIPVGVYRTAENTDTNVVEGSFFLADLMGMEVRDAASGAVLGQIADILTLPANNVYVVRGGARELMIPAVDQFIAEVNVDEGYLRVNMMEGL